MGLLSNIFGRKVRESAFVDFEVSMSCGHCEKRVKELLAEDSAVVSTKIDLPSKIVSIQYDAQETNEQKLQEAIESLGFQVSKKQL